MTYILEKLYNDKYKFKITLPSKKSLKFGDSKYEDYTYHGNYDRMLRYLARHNKEDWSKKNIASKAFWSRWLLWSKPSLKLAINYIQKKFNITIKQIKK